MARGRAGGARGGFAHHFYHHVRTPRELRSLGAASAALAGIAADHRRLHRIRAATFRAHGSPVVSQGTDAPRPNLTRSAADACRIAFGVAAALPQYPSVLGEARAAMGAG